MKKIPVLGIFICILLAPIGLLAQSKLSVLPNSTKLSEIRVVGSQRFQLAELVSATGLKVGGDGSEAALKDGADRLASSGMFNDVTYSYTSAPNGTRVEYHLNDIEKLVPANFDNFVWLPRDVLVTEIKKREPLFVGSVPNAGEMYDKLADDIKSILNDRQVAATVKVFPQVPQYGGEVIGFTYHVEGVKLPISSLEFAGASSEMSTILQKDAQASMLQTEYSDPECAQLLRLV